MSSISCKLIILGVAASAAAPGEAQNAPSPVYLAYAGPHSSSPASAFGHLFLLLPEAENTPVPLWDVVSFAADTDGAGVVKFFVGGIAGAFDGSYERLKFHEKSRDYEALDDRDLWLLELKLSLEERDRLNAAIGRTEGKQYPYTFFVRNCAYYLQRLLSEIDIGVPPPAGPTSPTGVWMLIEELSKGGDTFFRPGASHRLESQLVRVWDENLERLRSEPWEAVVGDTAWIESLEPSALAPVNDFVGWRMLHRRTLLPEEVLAGVTVLRQRMIAGAGIGQAARLGPSGSIGEAVRTPAFHGYQRLSLGYGSRGGRNRVHARFRPALHDAADPWVAHRPVNTLEFLSVEVSAVPSTGHLRLETLTLFSQRSLNAGSWLNRQGSWMLEAQVERGGILSDGLHAIIRSGVGRAVEVKALHGYGLLTAGVAATNEERSVSLGIEAGALFVISDRWRTGIKSNHERGISDFQHLAFTRTEFWLRRDVTANLGIRLVSHLNPHGLEYKLVTDWYPN